MENYSIIHPPEIAARVQKYKSQMRRVRREHDCTLSAASLGGEIRSCYHCLDRDMKTLRFLVMVTLLALEVIKCDGEWCHHKKISLVSRKIA